MRLVEHNLHRIASCSAYLGMLIGSGVAAWVALRSGAPEPLAVSIIWLIACVLIFAAQRLWPHDDRWRGWKPDLGVDILHTVFSNGVATLLFQAAALGLVFQASDFGSRALGATLWPAHWPLIGQLAAALVIAELGSYGFHRLCHEVPLLWRLHALHHSSERLYALSAGRTHPINVVGIYLSGVLPLILLGARGELLAYIAVFTSVHGLLQHANIALDLGPLNWIFAGPDLHRRHHSVVMAESRANYGSNLIVWDIVFRTRQLPADHAQTALDVGLPEMDFRRNYFRHLLSPFQWRRMFMRSDAPLPSTGESA